MFRKWLSGYYRRNKEKIELLMKVLIIVAFVVFIMSFIFRNSSNKETNINEDTSQTIYKPKETIISGSNVKEEKYEEDSNTVKEFVDYCNNGKVQEAYNLLTEECKENIYPTLEKFKQKYCDIYFSEKREYSLQAWVNDGIHTTYQMRITNDILSTGAYEDGKAYQDYITIVDDGENKKININSYIGRNEIYKTTELEGINIVAERVDVYADFEEYTIEVTNNTDNTIMLDSMQSPAYTLRVLAGDDKTYAVRINSINYSKLLINPGETRKIKIEFSKKYGNSSASQQIMFSKVVKNYNEFINNKTEYNDFMEIKVKV